MLGDTEHLGKLGSLLQERSGFAKIHGCCTQAYNDGLAWVWIDTCCISRAASDAKSEGMLCV